MPTGRKTPCRAGFVKLCISFAHMGPHNVMEIIVPTDLARRLLGSSDQTGPVKIVQHFLDLMGSYSLTPLNNIPTRISKTTASIIDNIFTNTINVLMAKVIVLDISDHYFLYTKITEKAINNAPEEDNLVWNFNRQNIILFQNKIKQTDFSYINNMDQVKLAYSNLSNRIVNTFEGTFRKVSLKGKYKNRLPWLTVRLRNMIKIKN